VKLRSFHIHGYSSRYHGSEGCSVCDQGTYWIRVMYEEYASFLIWCETRNSRCRRRRLDFVLYACRKSVHSRIVVQRTCYGSLADLPQIPNITRAVLIECWPRCSHRVAGLRRFRTKGVSEGFVVKVAGGVAVASVDKRQSVSVCEHAVSLQFINNLKRQPAYRRS
jgi:hypothetical protein